MNRILTILLLTAQFVFGQETNRFDEIVQTTVDCINISSADELVPHLAPDFAMAGQTGEVAKMVLNQVFTQLGETVQSSKKTSEERSNDETELRYLFEYEKMGEKEAVFIFDQNNLLKELELFEMEVKTMSNDTEVIKSDKDVLSLQFETINNLIIVDVLLDGVTRKFILDTGAPEVILNLSHFQSADSTAQSISSVKGVNGSINNMDILRVDELDFAGITLNNQEILSMDLAHLEEELNYEFYGLIGYKLIKDYDLLFDYTNHTLTFIKPEHFEKYKSQHLSNKELNTVPFELEGHIPILKAKIGDRTFSFGLDTGAESNLIDDDLFSPMKNELRKISKDGLSGADKNSKEVMSAEVKTVKIGTSSFKNVSSVFSDVSHINEGYKVKIDGLIGYPILSKQKTLISFKRKELVLIE